MRTYLIVSCAIFVLVTAAHLARVVLEGAGTLGDPTFVFSSVVSIVMVAWGIRLLRRRRGGHDADHEA